MTDKAKRIIRAIYLGPVYLYRKTLSAYMGRDCLYEPTCSAYMIEAVYKHGIFKGTLLGAARILRCNRLFMGGSDPVPPVFSFKAIKNDFIIYRRRR
jgi:putative membrane protein insertion efficiency factor